MRRIGVLGPVKSGGQRLKIAGIVLLGLYFLFVVLSLDVETIVLAFLVLGVLAWLGWRQAFAVGVVLIVFAVLMGVFGAFVGLFGAYGGSIYVGIIIFAGPPGVTGFVYVAAGLVEQRARRKLLAEVPSADATV